MAPDVGRRERSASRPERRTVLGYPVDPVDLEQAASIVLDRAKTGPVATVVTLNPEIVVAALDDPGLAEAIATADLCVADGVGIVWAARREGVNLPARVPGVELAERLLERGGPELPTFFLGGRPGIAERAARAAAERFSTPVVGVRDGYFEATSDREVADEVAASGARLLLAGLGPRQERFLADQRNHLGPLVAIGVGGTLDVLAGEAKRTPAWTRRFGLEWAWRVGLDRSRWHRAPRLARFVGHVLARSMRR